MPLSEQLLHLGNKEFWFITLFALAAASGGFYLAFHYLRRARIIEDTPTANIRSAHQGYVELTGIARQMEGEPILAPLTKLPCCWYSYKVERRGDKGWFTVDSGSSESLFLLRDSTGDCIIDPEGADVTSNQRDVWQGDSSIATPTIGNKLPSGWKLLLKLGREINSTEVIGSGHRYTETRIHDGDRLYAIGLFKSLDEVDNIQQRSEIARDLLRQWKRDRSSMLLEFDHNRDGHIDLEEWEQVRQRAQAQAQLEQEQLTQGQVLHTLSATGSRQHPFLISNLPEFDLVRRYRMYVVLATTTFFLSGALAVWLLTIKLT